MFSMVNAIPHQLFKRNTRFEQCNPIAPVTTSPPLLDVTLSPDPVVPGLLVSFIISGELSGPIVDSDIMILLQVNI